MKELKELLKSEAGRLLKNYLIKHYDKFNNLEAINDMLIADELALDIKARIKARDWIKNILIEITDSETFNEKEIKEEDKLYSL